MYKNRDREPYSFANINLLGKCNINCFFCLGKDIEKELSKHNQLQTHFDKWKDFSYFIKKCNYHSIEKIYITGQNCDSLQYKYLDELIDFLHKNDFKVGLRTNGYLSEYRMDEINKCELSVGYSIHSLTPMLNKMMLGTDRIPNWEDIIPNTKNCRVQIVVNRINEYEFWDVIKYISQFDNVKYIQARRISTDTREKLLEPDIAAYERIYTQVSKIFPLKKKIWADAEIYEICGKEVCFWRTIKTSVNSINYFTDGTLSDLYFIIEGYLKYYRGEYDHNKI